jgi:thioredoxin reductase
MMMIMNKDYDVCVIGGGAAGMSAALGAVKNGADKVILLERDVELGGILQQCIHNGFGLHTFNEELTGPAYAEKVKEQLLATNCEIKLKTTVIKITKDKSVHFMNEIDGYKMIDAKAIIVAMGCRERTSHQIELPGKRLAGIMTSGVAQRYLNIDGYLVGKKVFILGSGDIGLIMARRMTLEGASVLGVAEIMPYSNGLNRNIVQCLHDFNIPLYLSHTVTKVSGKNRLEQVTIAEVDQEFKFKVGTEKTFDVDTLLLSVGLIPENTLLKEISVDLNPFTNGALVDELYQTSIPGIFACGNSLHVHDLVDYASEEGYETGKSASIFVKRNEKKINYINIRPLNNVRYVIPNKVYIEDLSGDVIFKFRVTKPIERGKLVARIGETVIKEVTKSNLHPSEMESININKLLLNQYKDGDITIEIRGDECD